MNNVQSDSNWMLDELLFQNHQKQSPSNLNIFCYVVFYFNFNRMCSNTAFLQKSIICYKAFFPHGKLRSSHNSTQQDPAKPAA